MQQIIGKRFVWNGQSKEFISKYPRELTVYKVLSEEDGTYSILYKDESTKSVVKSVITEKDLFLNYKAIRPTHVITYHRGIVKTNNNLLYDLDITICKYDPDAEQAPILKFSLYDWMMYCVSHDKNKELHIRNTGQAYYEAMTTMVDSDSSPIIYSGSSKLPKEIYYCYLDTSYASNAITGVIPKNLISYLYGLTNKLEDYDDSYAKVGISVKDLVYLETKYKDFLFNDICFESVVLKYLGYEDFQFAYDKTCLGPMGNNTANDFIEFYYNAIKQDYSTLMRNVQYNWMMDFLNRCSKSLIYSGIPFLPLYGINTEKPIVIRLREENDKELEELRNKLASENKFLMQVFFKANDSIALVIFDSVKPPDYDQPALTDEELAIFMKHKK